MRDGALLHSQASTRFDCRRQSMACRRGRLRSRFKNRGSPCSPNIEPLPYSIDGNRPADEIALCNVAVYFAQRLPIVLSFHALCDTFHTQPPGNADTSFEHRTDDWIFSRSANKRAVDLQLGKGYVAKLRER